MTKPRIFLGSSGKQAKLLKAITRGLEDVADVEPWTTTFNPGIHPRPARRALPGGRFRRLRVRPGRLDPDGRVPVRPGVAARQRGVRGRLVRRRAGMRRTFILHAHDSKLPTDLLGLTAVRYDPATSPAEVRAINQKIRKAIEAEGRRGPVEGLWWQLSLTARSEDEPSAVSLLRISRDRDGGLNVNGRAWQEDGTLSARYWSEAAKERRDPAGIFYFWPGSAPGTRTPRSSRAPARSRWRPRSRHRALDHAVGSRRRVEYAHLRRLSPRRPLGPRGAGRRERERSGRRSSRGASRNGGPRRTRREPDAALGRR